MKGNGLLLLFNNVSVLCFLSVIMFSGGSTDPSLLFVSILPFTLACFFGYCFKAYALEDMVLNKILLNSIRGIFIVSLAHILTSFANLGFVGSFANRGDDTVFGLFSIYQKLVYYPTVLSLYFVLSLFIRSKYGSFMSIILFLNVLMIGSRESLLICALGFFVKNYQILAKNPMKFLFYGFLVIIFLGTIAYVYQVRIVAIFEKATFVNKFNNLQDRADAGRLDAARLVFSNSEKDFDFFVGTGYSMSKGDQRSPHNQFLEIYLRSGFLGMFFFLMMLVNVFFKAKKEVLWHKKNSTPYYHSVFAMYLILCLTIMVSFNVNVPVRAPYSSVLFGFICGYFAND